MAAKRIPGDGKSGNCLSAFLSLSVRLESSEELVAEAVDSVPLAAFDCEMNGSGVVAG
jgi:hypothetical protein